MTGHEPLESVVYVTLHVYRYKSGWEIYFLWAQEKPKLKALFSYIFFSSLFYEKFLSICV